MKLYTINATPYREQDSQEGNNASLKYYPENVAKVLSAYGIDGFTIYQVQGYWKGKAEVSYKIEIAIDRDNSYNVITGIARELKVMYEQESVMVTLPTNEVLFV